MGAEIFWMALYLAVGSIGTVLFHRRGRNVVGDRRLRLLTMLDQHRSETIGANPLAEADLRTALR